MTPEGIIKNRVKRILAQHAPHVYYRMHVPSGYGKPTLDFDGAVRGRAFSIETKAPGRKLSPRQDQTIEEMLAGGVRVFVIDGDDGCAILDRWLAAIIRSST